VLSCRTKLLKLLCLKNLPRSSREKSSFFHTVKLQVQAHRACVRHSVLMRRCTIMNARIHEILVIRPTTNVLTNAHFSCAHLAGMSGEHLLPPLLQETMSSVAGSLTKSYLQRRQHCDLGYGELVSDRGRVLSMPVPICMWGVGRSGGRTILSRTVVAVNPGRWRWRSSERLAGSCQRPCDGWPRRARPAGELCWAATRLLAGRTRE